MNRTLFRRVARLEGAGKGASPTWEQYLAADGRLEHPPAGYSERERQRDQSLVERWVAAVVAAGCPL